MQSYLHELRQYPRLSPEEEHEIAVRFAKTGDGELSARLVTANLRLVRSIALKYRAEHSNLLDLVQEGNLGLLHAVRKYDPNRGVKLGTYAAWWIRAYILNFILSNSRLVKVGTTQAQRRLFFGLGKERARIERSGRVAEVQQLAAALNVKEKEVMEMERRLAVCDTSLDSPVGHQEDGGHVTYGDFVRADPRLRPDHQSETKEFSELLRTRLVEFAKKLPARESEIFWRRLFSEETVTLAEIADDFGISRERIRQLEGQLKKGLRRYLEASFGDGVEMMASLVN